MLEVPTGRRSSLREWLRCASCFLCCPRVLVWAHAPLAWPSTERKEAPGILGGMWNHVLGLFYVLPGSGGCCVLFSDLLPLTKPGKLSSLSVFVCSPAVRLCPKQIRVDNVWQWLITAWDSKAKMDRFDIKQLQKWPFFPCIWLWSWYQRQPGNKRFCSPLVGGEKCQAICPSTKEEQHVGWLWNKKGSKVFIQF